MEESQKKFLDNSPPMKIPADLPTNSKVPFQVDTILWIILSCVTLYYTDLISVLRTHSLTNGTSFSLGLWLGGAALTIAIYLIVWCTYVRGVSPDDWETYNPFAIPFATGFGLLSGLCFNIALYDVYGIKTPIITLILFMGFVMLVSIIPSWSPVERNNRRQPLSNSKWEESHGKME